MSDAVIDTGRVQSDRVADQLAIHQVLAMHSRGVDRADEAILKSAYWPDAEVAYGGFNGSAHVFCTALPTAVRRFAHTQHCLSNTCIAFVTDTQARVETCVTAYHYLAVQDAPDTEMTFLGRYLDHMEKRADTWKILHRRVVMDWNQNAPGSARWEGPPFDGMARGGHTPDDPLYEFLAL